jgi:N-acetylneuraminate lyase
MNTAFRFLAAPHTPFDRDGNLHLDFVALQAERLARTHVDGAFVGGTTGETSSLTVDERMALGQRWCDAAGDHDLEVIVHVGHNCQADACRLAAHAQSIHADAVAAHAPCYIRPSTVDDLIDFLAPVAASAADLPFYFYDIPITTHVRLPMVELLERGKRRIPNLAGLKYSNDDLVQMQECVRMHDGEFEILFGRDEALLAAVGLGVAGAVGSTYNFAAPLYHRMLRAYDAGDMVAARAAQALSVALVRAIAAFGFLPASKVVMSTLGVEVGPARPPLRNLDAEQTASLRRKLDELGFFEEGVSAPSQVSERVRDS